MNVRPIILFLFSCFYDFNEFNNRGFGLVKMLNPSKQTAYSPDLSTTEQVLIVRK